MSQRRGDEFVNQRVPASQSATSALPGSGAPPGPVEQVAAGMRRAATVSARLLQGCLASYSVADPRLPRAFFSAQARFQRTQWLLSAADDLRLPMSEGNRSLSIRLFNWYRRQLVT